MWRLFLVVGLVACIGSGPVFSQEWSGTAALDLSGSYQTNLYLDPVLGTWNRRVSPTFLGATPRMGLTRRTSQTRMDVTVRSRMHPQRSEIPQFTQGTFRVRYHVTPNWTLGSLAGGTRYRFPADQGGVTTMRDSWWLLPSLRWSPTSETMVSLRTGLTQRYERSFDPTDRQTSGLGALQVKHWLSDRVQGHARLYVSSGRTSTAETAFGGSGGGLGVTYWPSASVSVKAKAAVEQLRYETFATTTGGVQQGTRSLETVRDHIGRGSLEVNWHVRPSITLYGRGKALRANLGVDSENVDVHASGGLRLQVNTVLGGTTEPPPRRRVCYNSENGLRLRVPHEGPGQPHVTGDFNGWSLPGIPMESIGDDEWEVTLDLSPGRYTYRLRAVSAETDEEEWLDLPSYAQSVEDAFGGTNGVCTVH